MSGDDRNKKDGERTDKKNQQMHERENESLQTSRPAHQAKAESNLTDTQPGPGDDTREP